MLNFEDMTIEVAGGEEEDGEPQLPVHNACLSFRQRVGCTHNI